VIKAGFALSYYILFGNGRKDFLERVYNYLRF